MYKVWYCTLKPPIILFSIEEVRTLSRMIEIVSGSNPYWEKFITFDD
tara:strand:- start:149 stop:289 length:141 start_codon:yes stop_codon:yes gene_type:complete